MPSTCGVLRLPHSATELGEAWPVDHIHIVLCEPSVRCGQITHGTENWAITGPTDLIIGICSVNIQVEGSFPASLLHAWAITIYLKEPKSFWQLNRPVLKRRLEYPCPYVTLRTTCVCSVFKVFLNKLVYQNEQIRFVISLKCVIYFRLEILN